MKQRIILLTLILFTLVSCDEKQEKDYPIHQVMFTSVNITDSFWTKRIETNRTVTIPYAFHKCEETGRIDNFRIAGGIKAGDFRTGRGFDDSDLFKVMEGAAYSLAAFPDPVLEAYLDSLIFYVGKAQEEDGYLYTLRTIMGDSTRTGKRYDRDLGKPRWLGVETGSHELYNIGHMYEAVVAHYNATGEKTFLDIAVKSADLVYRDFGWGKLEMFPGHQEIELALIKLYGATGDEKYLDLAMFFLDVRGKTETKWTYNQSHIPVVEQDEAVGHAVRALYMYTGMADLAALTYNPEYIEAMDRLWHNISDYQLYITGGVGAPGGNEGFAGRYDLSNHNAYCETCAAIANVFWNYRLFLMHGEARYMDIVERSMYNNVISGISLVGDRFFYPNRLESPGNIERKEWFNVSCCPTNIARFIPSVPGYIYASGSDEVYVNLFISSVADIELERKRIRIVQESTVPWGGDVRIRIETPTPVRFNLKTRMPSWADRAPLSSDLYLFTDENPGETIVHINGEPARTTIEDGYISIDRRWSNQDSVVFSFPFEIRTVVAHDSVTANRGKRAFQAGPLVYATEAIDQETGTVLNLVLDENEPLTFGDSEILGNRIRTIAGSGYAVGVMQSGEVSREKVTIKMIPYYSWAHRGMGEMAVWLQVDDKYSGVHGSFER